MEPASLTNPTNQSSDRTLWIAIFALLAAGLVMIYSTSFFFAQENFHDGLYFFKRHLIFMSVGLVAFGVGWKVKAFGLQKLSKPLFIFTLVLLGLTLLPSLSYKAGGARRWINILGFSFQSAELAKFSVILFIANLLDKKIHLQDNFRSGLLTYFVVPMPVFILLLAQPDFGSTALILCTVFLMLLSCGVYYRYLLSAVAMLIPSALFLIYSSPYRKARLMSFLDPWSDPANKGFQIIQSLLAFFSGKWLGVGIGNSREKLFYLPEAHNDFIFAVVGEELGLFGVCFFVGLFLVVILRGLKAVEHTKDIFNRALITGIVANIGLQAFFNMAVVLGMLPTKGLPLPLISYGGTSLIMTLFMLGLLTQLSEVNQKAV